MSGEILKGVDALSGLGKMPDDTILCITLAITQ
ncbi:hypothetical protein SAMN04490193_1472 [Pseudomonas marginalis]|nr:hypothetical protein SAMN04490193_1472 [Pseudomonas marginalis]